MSTSFSERVKNRFLDACLLAFFLGIFGSIAYASISWPATPSGETTGGKYSLKLMPSTAVIAFNSSTCPAGWIPADGTN